MWYLTLSIASALAFQWGRIVLVSRGSLDQVATYSIAMQFYAPLWSFFIVAGTSLWPVFARGRALNESQSSILARMITYFVIAASGCVVGLVLFGPWLASLISHNAVRTNFLIFFSCGLLLVVQSVQLVLGVSLTSPRDLRFQALWAIPMAVAVTVTTWLTVPLLGGPAPFIAASSGVLLFQILPNIFRAASNERRVLAGHPVRQLIGSE
jgi:O-antigen/teichoic acid export membrane protein